MYTLARIVIDLIMVFLIGVGCIFLHEGGTTEAILYFILGLAGLFRKQIAALWRKSRQKADERRRDSWALDLGKRYRYYTLHGFLEAGLPLAGGVACTVNLDGDTLDVEGGGLTFSLNYSKVTDIRLQTRAEAQGFLVSSSGSVLLDTSMAKPDNREIDYLLVTYLKEMKPKYLLLRLNHLPSDYSRIRKIIEEQREKIPKNSVHIEL